MNKKLVIELSIVFVGALILGGLVYSTYLKKEETPLPVVEACPTDVMICPDGTSVARSGPACEFGVCKQELPNYMQQEPSNTPTPSTTTQPVPTQKSAPDITPPTVLKKITATVASLFKQEPVAPVAQPNTPTTPVTPQVAAEQPVSQGSTPTSNTPKPAIDETRYAIENSKIVDENKNVIYTLPGTSSNSSGSGYTDIHDVNVVPVNDIAPVIGAIPVDGLPGKYYLSENSFNANSECKFSNKIYILDTKTGTRTLMYEENSEVLSQEDPRSCTSEMFLLATEKEKLILKYHTIDTNMTCESTWSEPEKTWYIDVTKPQNGTKRYPISYTLYQQAETKEEACRTLIDASSTPTTNATDTTIGG